MTALLQSASAALMQRCTLFANHVLASEPVATERLRAHAGKRLRIELRHWPALLPALPELNFDITAAGLLEWQGTAAIDEPALRLVVDAANPALVVARGLTGDRPSVEVQGDAALASDVSWLIDNLRWEVSDDLSRFVGPVAAQAMARVGRLLARGLREALRLASTLAPRRDPGAGAG
jgi:ubiquinone biosynthesis accessory factor UbiJ